jgi:hypothetical protein
MLKLTTWVETYKSQRLMTSCVSCFPSAEDTGAGEGEGGMVLLVSKDFLSGITIIALEILSISHVGGDTIDDRVRVASSLSPVRVFTHESGLDYQRCLDGDLDCC